MKNDKIKNFLTDWGLLAFTVLVFIIFAVLQPRFLSVSNFMVVLRQTAVTGILALGLLFTIVAGEFDLSFPSVATMAAAITFVFLEMGMSITLAIIIALAFGILVGLINSFIVIKLRVPAFIATLGMMGLIQGIARIITDGTTIFLRNMPPMLNLIARGYFKNIVPYQVFLFLGLFVVAAFLLEKCYIGRHLYAVGGNVDASRHVGIKVNKLKLFAYVMTGIFAVIGGILAGGQLAAVNAELGSGFLMPAISAVFMGGVFLRKGLPNVWGTILASFLMAMLANGFIMLGFSEAIKEVVEGLILLTAISLTTTMSSQDIVEIDM